MTVSLRLNIGSEVAIVRVYDNTSLQISKFLTSVDNLSKSGTITEERFRVYITDELIELIGDLTNPSQDIAIDINKSVPGEILVDGFPRFKGSFFILEAFVDPVSNLKEMELLFQGGETNVKAELTAISMAELFEGETIDYTFLEIKEYLDNPLPYVLNNGYFFPLIDIGQRWSGITPLATGRTDFTRLGQADFSVCVTIKKCLELMPIQITIDIDLEFLGSGGILLRNDKKELLTLNTSPKNYTGIATTTPDYTTVKSTTGTEFRALRLDAKSLYNPAQDNFNLAFNFYEVPFTGDYTFRLVGDYSITNNQAFGDSDSFYFKLIDDTTLATIQILGNSYPGISAGITGDYSIDVTFNARLNKGQNIAVQFYMWGTTGDRVVIKDGFQFIVVETPALSTDSQLLVDKNCPNLSAWDILTHLLIQCNGVLESKSDGTYNIIPWTKWIDQGTTSYFIENILDANTTVSMQPYSLEGAKTIELGYKKGKDYYSIAYQEQQEGVYGDLIIQDTGTSFTKNKITLRSPLGNFPSAYVEGTSTVIQFLYDKDFKLISPEPKYIQFNALRFTPMIFLLEDSTGINTNLYNYRQIPFLGNWSNQSGGFTNERDYNFGQSLNFWSATGYPNNTLYELYWRRYIENTYTRDSRILKCSIRLTQNEFDNLQFNEKFYYKGSLFRLIEISGYEMTEKNTVNATFMKLFDIPNIDKAPFYPYNVIGAVVQWKDSSDNTDLGDASGEAPADVEASANAYGFFYDSNQNIATQIGQILQT